MTITEARTLFKTPKVKLPVGRISMPDEPIGSEDGDFDDHILFDWNSMGGPFVLCERKLRRGLSVAATHDEFDGYKLVALIEPDTPDVWAAYYRQVFLTKGAAYGFGLFGSLPHEITNCKPGLLPEELLREGMWDAFRVLASEDEATFTDSIGEAFERMPPLVRECQLELWDDVCLYPHRDDNRNGDGRSRLELRWLFDWYWKQVYSRE